MIIKACLYSSKSSMAETGRDAGLTETQLENFVYALYEVEFDIDVDDDGNATIVAVNGIPLTQPVRG